MLLDLALAKKPNHRCT